MLREMPVFTFRLVAALKAKSKWTVQTLKKSAKNQLNVLYLWHTADVSESVKGSYCQGLNFTLKGCARNAQHHEAITLAMAKWMDSYYKLDGMCDELLTTGPAQLYKDLKHYLQVESGKPGAALSVPSDNIKQPIPQVFTYFNPDMYF